MARQVAHTSATSELPTSPSDMGFVLSTQGNNILPNMTHFQREQLGRTEWFSSGHVVADRDLAIGEVLTAYRIQGGDGRLLDSITFTATSANCKKAQWPQAFAEAINAAALPLQAGNWQDDGSFGASTASDGNRLWYHGNANRAFTTAAFADNWVQALAITGEALLADTQLEVQVRDLSTQTLYETHHFTPKTNRLAFADWAQDLCSQLNDNSKLVKAGVRDATKAAIAPGNSGNALWVPQCSDLAVTLMEAKWWSEGNVASEVDLNEGEQVYVYALDAFSNAGFDKAFGYTASSNEKNRKKDAWLGDLASQLNASPLGRQVSLGIAGGHSFSGPNTTAELGGLWQLGTTTKVFTTAPAASNWVQVSEPLNTLFKSVTGAITINVRQPGNATVLDSFRYQPDPKTPPTDRTAWVKALRDAINKHAAVYLRAGEAPAGAGRLLTASDNIDELRLWVPRYSGLEVLIEEGAGSVAVASVSQRRTRYKASKVYKADQSAIPSAWTQTLHIKILDENPSIVIRLSSAAMSKGIRCVSFLAKEHPFDQATGVHVTGTSVTLLPGAQRKGLYQLELDIPSTVAAGESFVVAHVGCTDAQGLWSASTALSITPVITDEGPTPSTLLCEDYGNTMGSEVFDTTGQSETGVDPRTGLFHAHYPIASFQGLEGIGPLCDLTLHYSALRGNEAGLGDGWAFRFSSLQVRDKKLVLAGGENIIFTDKEWKDLKAQRQVKRQACWVTATADYKAFTLDFPTGRREVLTAPPGDAEEPNDELRKKIIGYLEQIKDASRPLPPKPEGALQWILTILAPLVMAGAAQLDYDAALRKWRKQTNEIDAQIAYWKSPDTQLMPSRVISPQGSELALDWTRMCGQFLLKAITAGDTSLFTAQYNQDNVEMEVWPKTNEAYRVTLGLSALLLKKLVRADRNGTAVQQIEYGYSPDPTLDRVLTRIKESDGSVERVIYESEAVHFLDDSKPALPRVMAHALLPRGTQENIFSEYSYHGNNYLLGRPSVGYDVGYKALVGGANKEIAYSYSVSVSDGTIVKPARLDYEQKARIENRLWSVAERVSQGRAYDYAISVIKKNPEIKNEALRAGMFMQNAKEFDFIARYFPYAVPELFWSEDVAYDGDRDSGVELENIVFNSYVTAVTRRSGSDVSSAVHTYNKDHIKVREAAHVGLTSKVTVWSYSGVSKESCGFGLPSAITTTFFRQESADVGKYRLPVFNSTPATTTTQTFTYNESGQITQSTTADGMTTHWCYYPAAGGKGLTLTPVLPTADNAKPLKAMTLSCPPVPEHTLPPLMAEYQCQTIEGKVLPLKLLTYGYTEKTLHNGRKALATAHAVSLGGVLADTAEGWTLSKAPDRTHALIQHEAYQEIPRKPKTQATDCKVMVWTNSAFQTSYWGNETTTFGTTQHWEDNPNEPGLVMRCTSKTDKAETTVVVETRSRYSRHLLAVKKDRTETRYTYGPLGRVVQEEKYRLAAGSNSVAKGARPDSQSTTAYTITPEGIVTTVTRADGYVIRQWADGLQREVLTEVRRPGTQGTQDEHFIPLQAVTYDGLGDEVNRTGFDYQPGGLQRAVERGYRQVLPHTANLWRTRSLEGDDKDSDSLEVLGVGHRVQLKSLATQKVQKDGGILRGESLSAADGTVRFATERKYDAEGRMTSLSRGTGKAAATVSIAYDDLGRPTTFTSPDGTVTTRSYFGLSTEISEIKVGNQTVARRTISKPSTVKASTIGERTYHYADSEQDTQVTLPDATVLHSGATADGNGMTLKAGGDTLSTLHFDPPKRRLEVATHQVASNVGGFKLGAYINTQTLPGLLGTTELKVKSPRGEADATQQRSTGGHWLAGQRFDGSQVRLFRDGWARTLRLLHNQLDYHYFYTEAGQLGTVTVTDSASGMRLHTRYHWDAFGQEAARDYVLNGSTVMRIEHSWLPDGQLGEKKLYRDGILSRSEAYTYDSRDRLIEYRCTAAQATDCPSDDSGARVQQQTFTWDALNNLTACTTTYTDGASRSQTHTYDAKNPTRRTQVTTASKAKGDAKATTVVAKLEWNLNGHLIKDEQGRTLSYTALGQLESVKDSAGTLITQYSYDALRRLVAQYDAATKATYELRYDGDRLCGEAWFDKDGKVSRRVMLGDHGVEQRATGTRIETRFVLSDPNSGAVAVYQRDNGQLNLQQTGYTPFGDNGEPLDACTGFNGERRDPVTGTYHLGNGYRTYDPTAMSWRQPDSLSPFDEGGINDYAYCAGDPVNQHDPSGHILISRWGEQQHLNMLDKALREIRPTPVGSFWRGIAVAAVETFVGILVSVPSGGASLGAAIAWVAASVLATVSLGLDIASKFLEESHPGLAKALGIASMAVGLISVAPLEGIGKQVGRFMRWAGSKVASVTKRVENTVRQSIGRLRFPKVKAPTSAGKQGDIALDVLGDISAFKQMAGSREFSSVQALTPARYSRSLATSSARRASSAPARASGGTRISASAARPGSAPPKLGAVAEPNKTWFQKAGDTFVDWAEGYVKDTLSNPVDKVLTWKQYFDTYNDTIGVGEAVNDFHNGAAENDEDRVNRARAFGYVRLDQAVSARQAVA